ncbi:MAG TPA: ABC-2 family transporter protein [Acidimicrobiales bacterium]|nr:ABC-2 family transporter protein [Acidimicrobiales bacterium]
MGDTMAVYGRLLAARIRGQWQYRTSFFVYLAAQFTITLLDFLVLLVIFTHVPRFAGWSLWEVALLYGLAGVSFRLADLVVSQVEYLPRHLLAGSFDRMLVRPLGALVQLSAEEFELRRVGTLAEALLVLGLAIAHVPVHWTWARVAVLVSSALSGAVIFACIWILGAAFTFLVVDGREFINAFTYGGNFLSQYPLQIYGTALRIILGIVVPIGFAAFFPVLYILGKPDPVTGVAVIRFLSPAVAAAMALLTRAAWRGAIRHHRSTGS